MSQSISFSVPGRAKPAGSKRALPVFGGTGANRKFLYANVVDDCETSADWKADVKFSAMAVYKGPLLTVALSVSFEFIQPRPLNDFGSGKNFENLKASAARWPTKKPDLLKLARGIEDAMTGIIYRDDNLIVQEVLRKDYADRRDGFIGVHITITPLESVDSEPLATKSEPSGVLELFAQKRAM